MRSTAGTQLYAVDTAGFGNVFVTAMYLSILCVSSAWSMGSYVR